MKDRPTNPRLARTPELEALLGATARRLRTQVWLHGVGSVLAVVAAWVVFAFLADRVLHVPHLVRVLHGLALVALVAYFTWRGLARPLLRIPDRSGLAILLEKAHPDLRQLLVSAVQFQRAEPDRSGDPALVQRVLQAADQRSHGLDPRGVFDESEPRARFLLGAGSFLALVALGLFNPLHARIFLDRMLGGSMSWPQRTHLAVDVPLSGAGVQVTRSPELIRVRVARGSDVPVLVQAEGVAPDEVTLHFDAGRDLVLNASGAGVFRTLLRSCQEDISFFATGGDDRDGRPHVEIEVLRPPDVEGIAVEVSPPAYSGLAPEVVFDRDVEVLAGSEVRVHVLPEPPEATGVVRTLPDERTLALTAGPFPRRPPGDGEARPDGDPPTGLYFELLAEKTIGFRVELSDGSGLSNPDPGLFRIRVVEDRPPEIQVLAPARLEFEVVKGGAFPLRARVSDDFGLAGMRWLVAAGADDEAEPAEHPFELRDLPPVEGRRARQVAVGGERVEVDELAGPDGSVAVEQRFTIDVVATDNRKPLANEGRTLSIRARVVTPEELLRRMQDRLGAARLTALRLSDLQREKRRRVEELVDAAQGDDGRLGGEVQALAAALGGQRRVHADAQELAHDLAAVTSDVIYARIDEKAGALLEFLDTRLQAIDDARFHSEPWRELAAAERASKLGASGFAGNLVELVDLALEIADEHTHQASLSLLEVERAPGGAEAQAALVRTIALQTRALERIDDLLGQLAEWDNFQNVLALTRDILNRQKALRERTQQFASEK